MTALAARARPPETTKGRLHTVTNDLIGRLWWCMPRDQPLEESTGTAEGLIVTLGVVVQAA